MAVTGTPVGVPWQAVMAVIAGATVLFGLAMFVFDTRQGSGLALFGRNLTVFVVPLLALFLYVVATWAANILAG